MRKVVAIALFIIAACASGASACEAQVIRGAAPLKGRITGQVVDQLLFSGPVPNAEVWIEGVTDTARTDSLGRFVLNDVPEGMHVVRVTHARLEQFSVLRPGVPVRVSSDTAREITLSSISPELFVQYLCGRERSVAALVLAVEGEQLDERRLAAVVRWSSLVIAPGGIREVRDSVPANRRGARHFVACGVPADAELSITLEEAGRVAARSTVTESTSLFRALSLTVGSDAHVGLLRVAVSSVDGAVRGARVTLLGDSAVLRRDGTDDVVIAAASGSRVVRVTAIGYQPINKNVVVPENGEQRVDVRLEPSAVQLSEVTVTGAADAAPRLSGFELRRRTSGGQFVTAEEIQRKRISVLSDALRSLLGVQVQTIGLVGVVRSGVSGETGIQLAGGGAVLKSLRGGKVNRNGVPIDCYLTLYVDGQRRSDLWSLDQIAPADVAGIELHNAVTAPVELVGLQGEDECGVVMVWTRSGRLAH